MKTENPNINQKKLSIFHDAFSNSEMNMKVVVHPHHHQCEKCQKKFTTREYLTIHQKNVHKGKKIYKCVKCDNLEFSTEQDLQNHFSEKHLLKNVHNRLANFVENNPKPKKNFNFYDQKNKDVNKQLMTSDEQQKNRLERLKKQVLNNDSNIGKKHAL